MVGVRAQGFKQLLPYRHDRIQAGGRLLENNAYLAAPHLAHALLRQAIELNRPQMYTSSGNTPGIGQQTQQGQGRHAFRSEEHTSELQSLMRTSYAVFCFQTTKTNINY